MAWWSQNRDGYGTCGGEGMARAEAQKHQSLAGTWDPGKLHRDLGSTPLREQGGPELEMGETGPSIGRRFESSP